MPTLLLDAVRVQSMDADLISSICDFLWVVKKFEAPGDALHASNV